MRRIIPFLAVLLPQVAAAGTPEGPRSHLDTVRPGRTDVYDLTFKGGEVAFIEVKGDGSTDLDCLVYDGAGNLADQDTDKGDWCMVHWYPKTTSRFTIKIVNRGPHPNSYRMTMN